MKGSDNMKIKNFSKLLSVINSVLGSKEFHRKQMSKIESLTASIENRKSKD
jgi:hypothetical protein